MKTKFILGFLFILITLVGLHNTHVLNYTRKKKLHTKHQKTFSSLFSILLPNTGKRNSFPKNTLWKINYVLENVNAETNRA